MAVLTRAQVAVSAAHLLGHANPERYPAVLGFDGFVDSIIHVVAKRHTATVFDRLNTIPEFAAKIGAAAGQSSNCELVITREKLGGNGPIMGNALAAMGFPLTYVGSLGLPEAHEAFAEFGKRATLLPIANPGYTDALEFMDGKLLLNKNQNLAEVTWGNIVGRVGKEKFVGLCEGAALWGFTNWTMLVGMTEIWEKMLSEVLPGMKAGARTLFVDLADPEKRSAEDLRKALGLLTEFQKYVTVILGLNLKEAVQVAGVLGLPKVADGDADGGLEKLEETAAGIRGKLNVATVVIHPRKGAAGATAANRASFAGPFVERPLISTGAGDHFNAGFAAGSLLGLPLAQALAMGTATSGYYVRNGVSPSVEQLVGFLRELPEGE